MPESTQVVVYIEMTPEDRARFVVDASHSIWPLIWKFFNSRGKVIDMSCTHVVDLVVFGVVTYTGAVVDLKSCQPLVSFESLGAVDACSIKITRFEPCMDEPYWPLSRVLLRKSEVMEILSPPVSETEESTTKDAPVVQVTEVPQKKRTRAKEPTSPHRRSERVRRSMDLQKEKKARLKQEQRMYEALEEDRRKERAWAKKERGKRDARFMQHLKAELREERKASQTPERLNDPKIREAINEKAEALEKAHIALERQQKDEAEARAELERVRASGNKENEIKARAAAWDALKKLNALEIEEQLARKDLERTKARPVAFSGAQERLTSQKVDQQLKSAIVKHMKVVKGKQDKPKKRLEEKKARVEEHNTLASKPPELPPPSLKMTADSTMAVYFQSQPAFCKRYLVDPKTSVWPVIHDFLSCAQKLVVSVTKYTFNMEVAGLSEYRGVVIDLGNPLAGITFEKIDLKHGSLVKIKDVLRSSAEPKWPAAIYLSGPRLLVELDGSFLNLKAGGFYHCDFLTCSWKSKCFEEPEEKDGEISLERHFKEVHKTYGVYTCPHRGCSEVLEHALLYEKHTIIDHQGIRLPRWNSALMESAMR